MGLALLDVADVIRPYPEVMALLRQVEDKGFLEELTGSRTGRKHETIEAFLDRTACVGRRDRHHEAALERTPHHSRTRDHRQHQEPRAGAGSGASSKEAGSVGEGTGSAGAIASPAGRERKAEEAKGKIDRVRTFIGYREYPKYGMVSRYFVYKLPCWKRPRLVEAHVIGEREDIFYLTFQELHDVVRKSTWMTSSSTAQEAFGRIRRSHRPGCSPRTARSSPARTDAMTCRPVRLSACRFPPEPSRAGPRHS